jgi:two-component system chemotaxis response regulator CheB
LSVRTIRVLVVEDSTTVREHLCDVLEREPDIDVIGAARDGQTAVALCRDLRPDLVTMDIVLPGISGVAAIERVMAECPTPILIVSSSTNRSVLFSTYDALAAGAVDVLEKPRGTEPFGAWEREFVAAIRVVARIPVITHVRARLGTLDRRPQSPSAAPRPRSSPALPQAPRPPPRSRSCEVVAVGASTGGPAAVVALLRSLPTSFAVPLLLVVHVGESFSLALTEWLDSQTKRRVRYARDGQSVSAAVGGVLMAPPDRHMVVREHHVHLTREPARHSCRPSVDVLFESVANDYGTAAAGCLLTGMGRDGAQGLLALRQRGGVTIAQDEATSVVYGMPREAMLLDAADHVIAIDDIGPLLMTLDQPQADKDS